MLQRRHTPPPLQRAAPVEDPGGEVRDRRVQRVEVSAGRRDDLVHSVNPAVWWERCSPRRRAITSGDSPGSRDATSVGTQLTRSAV